MTQKRRFLTPAGSVELQSELSNLKSVRRPDVSARIREATETGGTVDNAEYEEVKNEQAFIEGRIQDLEEILANSTVTQRDKRVADTVQFGSSVTVTGEDGKRRSYQLVGSAEAKPLEGKISNESPVGLALLDRKIGDEVEVKTPSGVSRLKIAKIS